MVRRGWFKVVLGALLVLSLIWGLSAFGSGAAAQQARVAYILQGDVWTRGLAAPTSTPTRITKDGGYSRPAWSASGAWLLAEREQVPLIIKVSSGEAHGVSPSGTALTPRWSPAQDRLAFIDDQGRLFVVNGDGSGQRQVAGPPIGQAASDPVWSTDGRRLAFSAPVVSASGQPAGAGLWRVAVEAGKPELLHQRTDGERPCVIPAAWTADDQTVIAWTFPMCTASLMADGLQLIAVPIGGQPRELGDALVHPDFVAASPIGPVAAVLGAGRQTWTNKRIHVFDAPGQAPATPAAPGGSPLFATPEDQAAISPSWSANGKQLAYVAMPDLGEAGGEAIREGLMKRKLFTITPGSSETPRQLTSDPRYRDESPHWLSNNRILFARLDEAGKASLWEVGTGNKEPVQVAELDLPPLNGFGYYGWVDWASLFDVWLPGRLK